LAKEVKEGFLQMNRCTGCGGQAVKCELLPAFDTTVGGMKVKLLGAVTQATCTACGEDAVAIPALEQLTVAVAMARALLPYRLHGRDVRLMRLALDMNGRKFAKAIRMKPETLSRWENDGQCLGGYADQLLRHNVCALLHKKEPTLDYDPADIAMMELVDTPSDFELPTFVLRRVVLRENHHEQDAWDRLPLAA